MYTPCAHILTQDPTEIQVLHSVMFILKSDSLALPVFHGTDIPEGSGPVVLQKVPHMDLSDYFPHA